MFPMFLFRKPSMPDAAGLAPRPRRRPSSPAAPTTSTAARSPGPTPTGTEIAEFAHGLLLGRREGVLVDPRRVGHGRRLPGRHDAERRPTQEACTGETGHAEAVRVVFDPSVVSYERAAPAVLGGPRPDPGLSARATTSGTQYRSAIFTHGPAQLALAEASRDHYQAALTKAGYGPITTEIREAPAFYFAEEYHQQYLSKVPNGYCPNHRTGVKLPADFAATPLQYVD